MLVYRPKWRETISSQLMTSSNQGYRQCNFLSWSCLPYGFWIGSSRWVGGLGNRFTNNSRFCNWSESRWCRRDIRLRRFRSTFGFCQQGGSTGKLGKNHHNQWCHNACNYRLWCWLPRCPETVWCWRTRGKCWYSSCHPRRRGIVVWARGTSLGCTLAGYSLGQCRSSNRGRNPNFRNCSYFHC